MATCRTCDDDSASSCATEVEELAAQLAEKDAIIASMTSPPPPPTPPPGADYPRDRAYNLLTLTQAYDWYAPHKEEEHASNSSDSYMRAYATELTPLRMLRCTGARRTATAAPSR